MSVEFQLPDLGEGITEAEIIRWLVKPGDTVALDQEVVEVQTDKAVVELPSPVAGTILRLHVSEGQIVPVQTVLFTIDEQAQTSPAEAGVRHKGAEAHISSLAAGSSSESSANSAILVASRGNGTKQDLEVKPGQERRRVLATPVARRMARELGIDIATISGSGPAGRVRTEDVQKLVTIRQTNGRGSDVARTDQLQPEEQAPASATTTTASQVTTPPPALSTPRPARQEAEPEEERIPLRGLRRRIAENMVLSVSTIPQVTSMVEVDASGLVELRRSVLAEAEAQGVKLSYLPLIIKALVHALRLYPYVNATIEGEQIVLKRTYHIGIATATPDGLLVPVLRSADQLTILEIAQEINRLAEAGRERRLQLHELRGSSFTISNYGTVGGFFATPIINPGEAGILGLGKIVKRPWVVDDRIEVRPILPLSFTADHRLIDGELAMRFLNTLVASLEQPNSLLLHMR